MLQFTLLSTIYLLETVAKAFTNDPIITIFSVPVDIEKRSGTLLHSFYSFRDISD